MELSYEDALKAFRSLAAEANSLPTIEVFLQGRGLLALHGIAEAVEVSHDGGTLTFWIGRLAWGTVRVDLPLRNARIRLLKPEDKPDVIRTELDNHIACWYELRFFSGMEDTGCFITQFNSRIALSITGFKPLDIQFNPKQEA